MLTGRNIKKRREGVKGIEAVKDLVRIHKEEKRKHYLKYNFNIDLQNHILGSLLKQHRPPIPIF